MQIIRYRATNPWRAVLHLGPAAFVAAVFLVAPATHAQSGSSAGTSAARELALPEGVREIRDLEVQ